MGTKTFGTAAGNNSHYFYILGSNTEMKADVAVSAPEDMYVDSIYVYCSTQNGSAATAKNALYHSGGTLEVQTALYTLSGSAGWQGQGIVLPYFFITAGSTMEGAVWTNTNGLQMYALLDGNPFDYGFSTFANPWSGGNTKSGWGGLAWYASYYPPVTATPNVWHATEGTTITCTGRSYSAGVTSITINGLGQNHIQVQSDTQLTFQIASGTTSGPLTLGSNAGSTTPGNFIIDSTCSSISPTSGSVGTTVTINGTGMNSVSSVMFYNGSSWINATSFTHVNDTQLTAVVPNGAQTGSIQLSNSVYATYTPTFTVAAMHVYRTSDSTWHSANVFVYRTSDNTWHQVQGVYVYRTSDGTWHSAS